jgi:membrane AbrB-like protein
MPQTLLSTAALIAFCGGVAMVLVVTLRVDPLTAYLATSPGGLDSAVIIAASSHADLSFITALQTVRILLVLFVGPPIARAVARRVDRNDHQLSEDGRSVVSGIPVSTGSQLIDSN